MVHRLNANLAQLESLLSPDLIIIGGGVSQDPWIVGAALAAGVPKPAPRG